MLSSLLLSGDSSTVGHKMIFLALPSDVYMSTMVMHSVHLARSALATTASPGGRIGHLALATVLDA